MKNTFTFNKTVLVLDGRSRATITIVRSLGLAGYEVDVGDEYKSFSSYSKFCTHSIIYPSAKDESEKFITYIKKLIANGKYCAIVPVRDHTTKCLVELNKDHKYNNILCIPDQNYYHIALSKISTIKLAEKYSIPHPKSIATTDYENDPDKLINVISDKMSYPLLLKPDFSSGSRGIIFVENSKKLQENIRYFLKSSGKGLVQEFIPYGGSYGVEMLYYNGKLKAQFTHKRLREFPVNGGPSTYRCSYRYSEIEDYSIKLLSSLNWNGVAMVEYRVDARTGIPKLMEINPRFWGSLAMAYYSGVDFPKLLVDLITNNKCEEIFEYNLNIKTRWLFWGDIFWFFSIKKNPLHNKEFFNFFNKNIYYDIINKNDMMPLFGLLVDSLRTLISFKKIKHVLFRGW